MTVDRTLLQKRLIKIVRRFPQKRILVVGDSIADQYVYGVIDRVSREAPVFILRHEQTETNPGGAGNCAANLASLGAEARLVSIIGGDEAGRMVHQKLEGAGVQFRGIYASPDTRTTTKTRILAGQLHSTRQQVIRVDYEGTKAYDLIPRALLLEQIVKNIKTADAVIISDYDCGVVNASVAETIRNAAEELGIPVVVDSRYRLSSFMNFSSATPNEDEIEQLLGVRLEDAGRFESVAEQLRQELAYKALLVTRGSLGLVLFQEGKKPLRLAAVGSRQPVDVTGAGDTVIATYTLAVASGSSFADAARLANLAGGIVVMKRGTATVQPSEIISLVKETESVGG